MKYINRDRNMIRQRLTLGLLAGPLVVSLSLIQAFFRTGFDWRHHANSQLALGEFGWIQSINFIVCGVLVWIFSLGVHGALQDRLGKNGCQ